MGKQIVVGLQAKQRVQNAAVSHVHLRHLHQPLADVDEVRRQPPHQHQVRQQVDVADDRWRRGGHAARQCRSVEQAALVVAEHRPKPPQRRRGHAHAELRDVALQVGAEEVQPPACAGLVASGGEGVREATAHPQLPLLVGADFERGQPGQFVVDDAPGQGFGRLLHQRVRSRAEQKELATALAGPTPVVDLPAQHLEQRRHALHLVQHD